MSNGCYICDGARTAILVTISQKVSDSLRGSVAKCLRFCEIFIANFVVNLLLQQFWTSASLWRSYWQNDTDLCVFVCLSCLVCPVCLSIYNVGALRPNGLMDQDETWHAGMPRPWPHCFTWGPGSPTPKGHSPQFPSILVMAKWLDGSRSHMVGR